MRRSLDRLMALGIVEPVGIGTRQQVRFREAHPLADSIRALFEAEHDT